MFLEHCLRWNLLKVYLVNCSKTIISLIISKGILMNKYSFENKRKKKEDNECTLRVSRHFIQDNQRFHCLQRHLQNELYDKPIHWQIKDSLSIYFSKHIQDNFFLLLIPSTSRNYPMRFQNNKKKANQKKFISRYLVSSSRTNTDSLIFITAYEIYWTSSRFIDNKGQSLLPLTS